MGVFVFMKLDLGSNILLFLPPKEGAYPLLTIFGGMAYANPEWMAKQLSEEYFSQSILLIVPYTETYTTALNFAQPKIDEKGYKVNDKSIMGFSAGGYDVQENFSDEFKFIGLIDPSVKSAYIDLPFDKRVFMLYNDNNWGKYPTIRSLQPQFAEKINENGGKAVLSKLPHDEIPKEFFKQFKSEMLKTTTLFKGGANAKGVWLMISSATMLVGVVGYLIYRRLRS